MTISVKKAAEFLVNTTWQTSYQRYSDLATLKNGNVVAVWTTQATHPGDGGDGSGYSIKATILKPNGTVAVTEFLVNTQTSDNQLIPEVLALSGGGFAVAWLDENTGGDGSGSAVKLQLFDSSGNKVGDEERINGTTSGHQQLPDIFEIDANTIGVTYDNDSTGDTEAGSIGVNKYYINTSSPSTPGVQVNNLGTGDQNSNASDVNKDGVIMTVWKTYDTSQDGDQGAIKARIYNPGSGDNFIAIGPEFLVNVNTHTGDQYQPEVVALKNGNFAVVWTTGDTSADGDSSALYYRVYKPDGTPIINEKLVNNKGTGSQGDASLAALDDGRFMVVWESKDGTDSSQEGIKGRIFNANGSAYGQEFLINHETSSRQIDPEITVLKNGKVMVSWTSTALGADSDLDAIKGRVIDVGSVYNGNNGANTKKGNGGRDEMNGKGGADNLKSLGGNDVIKSGAGNDKADGGGGKDTVRGQGGNDTLKGGKGNDKVLGGKGKDTLEGGNGKDVLKGDGGNDTLKGGKGNDKLTGSAGKDIFVFAKKQGKDTITDFQNGKDKIDLKAFNFASKAKALAKFHEIGNNHDDKIGFTHKGTEIVIKGINLSDLNGADILI